MNPKYDAIFDFRNFTRFEFPKKRSSDRTPYDLLNFIVRSPLSRENKS